MERITKHFEHCVSILSEAKRLQVRYTEKNKNLQQLTKELEDTIEAIELNKHIINEDANKFIETIEGLLTLGVQKIFYDVEDPKVSIIIKEGARNSATIQYSYTDYRGIEIDADVRKASGGGVRAVIGFLLQVFFISYYKLDRIIFADEAFKELSKAYRPKFLEFLKELSEDSRYKFLMITHDDDIVENADYIYRMENGILRREQ